VNCYTKHIMYCKHIVKNLPGSPVVVVVPRNPGIFM
jgi:hypothetical protein